MHYHLRCPHCISQVNTAKLEIRTTRILPPSIKGNPLCWTSKDRIIASIPQEPSTLQVVEFSSYTKQPELYMIGALGVKTVEEILMSIDKQDSSEPNLEIIPIIWTLKIPVDGFFKNLVCQLVIATMFSKLARDSFNWGEGLFGLLFACQVQISEISDYHYTCLAPLWYFSETRQEIMQCFPSVEMPTAVPYTLSSICRSIRGVILENIWSVTLTDLVLFCSATTIYPTTRRGVSTLWKCCFSAIIEQEQSVSIKLACLWFCKTVLTSITLDGLDGSSIQTPRSR
nr:RNA-dependent RNA polymerase [Nuttalliella namaqua]